MKIICENQEEYDNLMEASKYLHDFTVWEKDMFGRRNKPISLDQEKGNNMVGFLCHLYLEGKDFPNKDEVIKIESKKLHIPKKPKLSEQEADDILDAICKK